MKLAEVTSNDLEVCHRLGSNQSKARPILVNVMIKSETEDKVNNDNNKEWKKEYYNNSEQAKCGNTRQEDNDNITDFDNYDIWDSRITIVSRKRETKIITYKD